MPYTPYMPLAISCKVTKLSESLEPTFRRGVGYQINSSRCGGGITNMSSIHGRNQQISPSCQICLHIHKPMTAIQTNVFSVAAAYVYLNTSHQYKLFLHENRYASTQQSERTSRPPWLCSVNANIKLIWVLSFVAKNRQVDGIGPRHINFYANTRIRYVECRPAEIILFFIIRTFFNKPLSVWYYMLLL